MDEITLADRASDQNGLYSRAPFLTTHRALAACTRELARLSDELHEGAGTLSTTLGTPTPVVRRPPGRCLIQLGPVALSAVWLRTTPDSAATGQLLINVWCGAIAPRMHHRPERPGEERAPVPATLLWERVLTATGDNEAAWLWEHEAADVPSVDSAALARLCVEQLGVAYVNATPNQETT